MLKMSIVAGDRTPWRWRDDRWESAQSWVCPLAHPALESALVTDGSAWMVVVRERSRQPVTSVWRSGHPLTQDAVAMQRLRDEAAGWPLDVLTVEGDMHATVTVRAGVWGVAPVYLTDVDGVLHGSWDYVDLLRFVGSGGLVDRVVARSLTYWRRYESATAFAGVHQLTERALARFGSAGLVIEYPPPAWHARPRVLREDGDVVAGFDAIFGEVVGRYAADPDRCAVALSGGLDSANVAMTLARMHPGRLRAAAVLIDGPAGVQQRRRRDALIGNAGGFVEDITVDGLLHLPLAPTTNPDSVLASAMEEPFDAALGVMAGELTGAGVTTLFGGTGGDELMALREDERAQSLEARWWVTPDWLTARTVQALHDGEEQLAPASVVSEVTLMGFACGNPLFLRRGIWPVDPLAAPELIRFAEWLPTGWRRRKRLLRERLIRLGVPAEVVDPPLRENLAGIMGAGLRRYGLPLLRALLADGLALANLGYVDGHRLRRALDLADDTAVADLDRRLHPLITWELTLRALDGRPGDTPDTPMSPDRRGDTRGEPGSFARGSR